MGRRRRESPAEGFLSDVFELRGKKGVRYLLCEAPSGPFRQKVPDTVFPLIAASVFGIFFFLIPWFLADRVGNDLTAQVSRMPYGIFRNLSRFMSLPLTAIILLIWGGAEFKKLARRRTSAAAARDARATRQRRPDCSEQSLNGKSIGDLCAARLQ